MDKIPESAREELESLSEDELDFLDQELFYAYDQAYAAYKQDDADNLEELALYERAMDTVSKIRSIKRNMDAEKIEQGKDIQDFMNNKL